MERTGIYRILTVLGTVALVVTLVAMGFAADCFPVTTRIISQSTSNASGAPYTHDQIVELAVATRDFTINNHQSDAAGAEAEAALAETVMQVASEAFNNPETASQWSTRAKEVVQSYMDGTDDALTAAIALSEVGENYALDKDAISHLEDCNGLIRIVTPLLLIFAALAVAVLLVLLALARTHRNAGEAYRYASRILILAPSILFVFLLVAGIWAAIDFYGFFSLFHKVFFPQGNWTFPSDSLLIRMYPTAFWMDMGALWLGVSLVASILSAAFGVILARIAKQREGNNNGPNNL